MYVSFVLLYFDFWTILVHGRFEDSSHFDRFIDTHFVWAACALTCKEAVRAVVLNPDRVTFKGGSLTEW